jgi:hypothetical protein
MRDEKIKDEVVKKLRESARIIHDWKLFRESDRNELKKIVYELHIIALMIKTYDDNNDKWVLIDLLQGVLNIVEYYSFEDFKDAVDKARVVKNLKDVMYLL